MNWKLLHENDTLDHNGEKMKPQKDDSVEKPEAKHL